MKVTKVRTMNMQGKVKRMGRFEGKRADWKKAIVTWLRATRSTSSTTSKWDAASRRGP